jgi:hypothetical protein
MQVGSRVRLKHFPDEEGTVVAMGATREKAKVAWKKAGIEVSYPLHALEEIEPPRPDMALTDMITRVANMTMALAHAERAARLIKGEYPEAKFKDTVKALRDTLTTLRHHLPKEHQDG